ncbi:MAG: peptidoglycan DD-metalloendopeptidase family protein [Chloroflexi bacterium]|nr:peptidoglycan DD-metalloendopeptidase family protein [Chloroflexota bacterium]
MQSHCRRRAFLLALAFVVLYGGVQAQEASQSDNAGRSRASASAAAVAETRSSTAAVGDLASIKPVEHNVLHRPIELSDGLTHWVDRSYPYGSTQQGARPVHLGVEFVNPRGTPVYAAKSGVVVFAGADDEILVGPQLDYYGQVVIVAHPIESLAGRQLFTVYGHLDETSVAVGQAVEDLTLLGHIGSSGVALGPHLHFETRVDDPYDFRMTRNPELWLQHYIDNGMIIGRIRDEEGAPVLGKRVSVRSNDFNRDVYSYEGRVVNSDPVWDEDFTVGDLPAGDYQVVVLDEVGKIAFAREVAVEPYRTTFVDIVLANALAAATPQR